MDRNINSNFARRDPFLPLILTTNNMIENVYKQASVASLHHRSKLINCKTLKPIQ